MAENIDGSSLGDIDPFNTKIPSLDDAANIQAALRLYHYGSTTAPANAEGITGGISSKLIELQNDIDNLSVVTPELLGASVDLNTKTDTGSYHQNSNTDARSGSNYPVYDGLAYKGLLTVVNIESIIYQTYQMYVSPTLVFIYTRIYDTSWSSWIRSSESSHIHDDRYYTETETNALLANKQNTISVTASRALVSDVDGKPAASSVTSTELGYVSGVTSSIQTQLNAKSASTHNHDDRYYAKNSFSATANTEHTARVFVQDSAPLSTNADTSKRPAVGDIWLW